MEAIPRLIFNLLVARERVVLPGIGTLYTDWQAATADASGGLTVPRVRVLHTAAEEGETLPELIAAESGLSLKEVKPHYNRWVSKLKNASSDGELAIGGVVLLIRQPDGSYWAEPARELDNLLNPIQPQKIELPVIPLQKEAKKQIETASKAVKKTVSEPRKSRTNRAAWLAAGGAVLVVLGYAAHFAWSRGFFDRTPDVPTVVIPVVIPPQPEIPVLSDTLPQADSLSAVSVDTVVVEQPPVTPETPAGDVYHVVAGVFSTRENAERYVSQNTFDASRTTVIPMANGKFMVSIGKYAEKEEADNEVNRLQAAHPQVWVSKRKQ